MAIFRDLLQRKNDVSDRSAGDRARHRELVKEAIKEQLPDIITEEGIIGSSGSKKVKIPIRSVKEWRFVYSNRQDGVGQGKGNKPGNTIGRVNENNGDRPKPGEGGNQSGETYVEVDREELIELMFEDLGLPFLERKKLHEVEIESEAKWEGLSQHGIESRLDLEESFLEKLRRQKMLEIKLEQAERNDPEEAKRIRQELEKMPFPFHEEDLRYHKVTVKTRKESNAVMFFIMDISGSMDVTKRYLAKAFLFILYRFIKTKYHRVETVFIAHDTEAIQVPEHDFFNLVGSGGTFISTGPLKAMELIQSAYMPDLWNIYVAHCSDGENFSADDERAVKAHKELAGVANLTGFIEIKSHGSWSTIGGKLEEGIKSPHFQLVRIKEKNQVWSKFVDFMNCDKKYRE